MRVAGRALRDEGALLRLRHGRRFQARLRFPQEERSPLRQAEIYKYDLDAAASSPPADDEATAAKMLEVRSFLADAKSREVFDAIAGRVLDPSAGIDVMLKTNEANQ
jgi:hypothetical protein